jgi:hypothetical protein
VKSFTHFQNILFQNISAGHPQLIKYLVENESEAKVAGKPMVDSHGCTLLHVATKERNVNKKDK